MPSAKKVPGGVKGRVSMTLQDGATTSDILTGILQVYSRSHPGLNSIHGGQPALHLSVAIAFADWANVICMKLKSSARPGLAPQQGNVDYLLVVPVQGFKPQGWPQ